MALRVLLADESSTIKRVMQLALQDFGVEVKSVPVGLDVLAVTKTFKPDIIFADVLLAKRNGYDVCQELKSDPETRNTPVVLMWSGFMEVDEARISQSGPDGRLEKPFDSETLRSLVQQMVPKTQSNPVSSFLQFPKMPEFSDERPKAQPTPAARATSPDRANSNERAETGGRPGFGKIPTSAPVDFESLSEEADQDDIFKIQNEQTFSGMTRSKDSKMDLPMIDNPDADPENDNELLVAMDEDFATVPLQPAQTRDQLEEDGWTQQDLKKFKIQTPEALPEDDFAKRFMIPPDELTNAHVEVEGEFEEIHFDDDLPDFAKPPVRSQTPSPRQPPVQQTPQPRAQAQAQAQPNKAAAPSAKQAAPLEQQMSPRDPALIERVIREEAREVIENICWKVIPEMVERIVREEINKILRETEKSL
jgi:two-component system cell cycle response regulator